ncbi:plexin-C1 [Rhinophrynus dorsalis]
MRSTDVTQAPSGAVPYHRKWSKQLMKPEVSWFVWSNPRTSGCQHERSEKNYTAALPINNTPTLRHGNLTAVFAIEVQRRMVFFLGTGNGQLLKVILDSNWKANCPEIVFEFKEETPVFRTIKADPVDSSYLYVATEKKIKRIKVANCEKYYSCHECLLANDPFCGWCNSQKSNLCITIESPTLHQVKHLTVYIVGGEESKDQCIHAPSPSTVPKRSIESVGAGRIKVTAINPEKMTYLGKQALTITGENLLQLQRVVLVGTSSCEPQDIKVSKVNDTQAILSLPQSRKEAKSICLNFDGNNCTETRNVYYESLPSCLEIFPNTTWLSGGRKISINGKNLNLMDDLILSYKSLPVNNVSIKVTKCKGNHMRCHFEAPPLPETKQHLILKIKVEDVFTLCGKLQYKNNPVFTSFSVFNDVAYVLELRIKKKHDDLNIQKDEIQVQIHYSNKTDPCLVQNITQSSEGSTVFCKATRDSKEKIEASKIKVTVTLGRFTVTLDSPRAGSSLYLLVLLVVPLLLIVILAAYLVTRRKSKEMSNKLSEQLERLECEVIQEIRDGFAELQMDKIDVTLKLGTIPFFVYKHFALKTLFPESEENKFNIIENLCEDIPSPFHTRSTMDEGENIPALRKLFENKKVLVLLIHTLEKQSTFSVKDRCMFASFLTINLQSNLVYLTEILEILIRDLMEESSNKHPKLMLRRTETVVEKLLTNWMSTCLYGFLRESVGEPLYLLVNTLNQRIHKGPIDVITCKALYTLNEDSLLWQMTEFSNVEINVNFPTISEIESEENPTQCIKVTVLDCDTIGQAKEKILQAFFNNKGYTFGASLCDICLELLHGQTQKELLDIDDSSVVLENGIRKLNTIKHYKVENGATINVVTKKNYDLPDIENSRKYCHLVLPNSEEAEDLGEQSKGKHKFKVKELYLTKLLSTKVAIHSSVEKLFQSIWTLPTNKPPVAIKHFFDFLDAQAENKKITDPDVLHIWKTNSLPLRFWVNILKNPQFVFDIKKTPLLESCLSVIAQAFMDSFSLAEQQLGKSAPTNKLLYAKDIPLFKEEVKTYYKVIRDAPPVSPMELKEFLMTESKKHEHEFKENVALLELYKYIDKYYNEILIALEKEPGFEEAHKQLLHIKALSEDKKKCKWEL